MPDGQRRDPRPATARSRPRRRWRQTGRRGGGRARRRRRFPGPPMVMACQPGFMPGFDGGFQLGPASIKPGLLVSLTAAAQQVDDRDKGDQEHEQTLGDQRAPSAVIGLIPIRPGIGFPDGWLDPPPPSPSTPSGTSKNKQPERATKARRIGSRGIGTNIDLSPCSDKPQELLGHNLFFAGGATDELGRYQRGPGPGP